MTMKKLKITWLSCEYCDGANAEQSHVVVSTEKGCGFRLYSGDKVECPVCFHHGVIDADGENAWVEWDALQ